jgi:lambda family phage portal protein
MSSLFTGKRTKPLPRNNLRYFKAGQYTHTSDFGSSLNINADLQGSLQTLRYRCRDVVQNNSVAAGIVSTYKNNIIGPNGVQITVQSKTKGGKLDIAANLAIQSAWEDFCSYGIPDVEGNKDLIKIQEMVLQSAAIDGEALIIIHRGDEFGKYRIQFEVNSIDILSDYNRVAENGNLIYQGIEINEFSRPVAYWLRKRDLNDPAQRIMPDSSTNVIRVPAEDVIHLYDVAYPKQIRGIPWLVTALLPLHHVSQLVSTELTMARLAATKRVVYTVEPDAESYQANPDDMDQFYNVNDQLDAASIEVLQPGMDVKSIDWQTPNTGLAEFRKVVLRDVASGTGVSYNTIANDLESVNYSSARFGALEQRTTFQAKQRWFGNAFIRRIYVEWLEVQLMYNSITLPSGATPFGIDKYDKFNDIKLTYKGWTSVDPLKDANASKAQLANMTTTFSEICSQEGKNFEDIIDLRVQEELLIRDKFTAAGLEVPEYNASIFGTPSTEEMEIEQTKANNQTTNSKDNENV